MYDIFIIEGLIAFKNLMIHFYFLFLCPKKPRSFTIFCYIGKAGCASFEEQNKGLHLRDHPIDEIIQKFDDIIGFGAQFLIQP